MDAIRTLLQELKEDLPLQRRIKLRVIPMEAHGSCSLSTNEQTITICLKRGDKPTVQTDSLIHEYAHAMEYDKHGNHSQSWGKYHSEVYTSWVKRHA